MSQQLCGGEGTRTPDFHDAIVTLYQAELRPQTTSEYNCGRVPLRRAKLLPPSRVKSPKRARTDRNRRVFGRSGRQTPGWPQSYRWIAHFGCALGKACG
jgi:hypothetical protein